MNRIVKEHYPASKLAEDLREGLAPGSHVTLMIDEGKGPPEKALTLDELFALRRPPYRSGAEIDEDVRLQRDEWDD
jgi:hypothetical protein